MRGHTLIELTFVLLLVGVTIVSIAPTARRARDHAAVVAAREALVGLFAEARQAAAESGGALVRISTSPAAAETFVGGLAVRRVELATEFEVAVALGGGGAGVDLHYDALGLGRVASQTVTLRRGSASAALVVSSYGRVRRP